MLGGAAKRSLLGWLSLFILGLLPLPSLGASRLAALVLHRQALRKACTQCSAGANATPVQDLPFSCCDELAKGGGSSTGPPAARQTRAGTFYLERVGLQGSGTFGPPKTDQASEASLCLTASPKENAVGGFGLRFQVCEGSVRTSRSAHGVRHLDPDLRLRQQFTLMPNGEIRTMDGLCVRRMRCTEVSSGRGFVYDVGWCDGPGYVAKFILQKSAANRLEHMQMLGYPEKVFRTMPCQACGPFMLLERCLSQGERYPKNMEICGEHYQAKPGFTKLPSQYVGDAAEQGRPPRIWSVDTVHDRLFPRKEGQQELAGLAASDWDGLCGSYATDGFNIDSFFVFHRVPAE